MDADKLVKEEANETLAHEAKESPAYQREEEETLINKIKDLEAELNNYKKKDMERDYSEAYKSAGFKDEYNDWISNASKNVFEKEGVNGVKKLWETDKRFDVFREKSDALTVPSENKEEPKKETKEEEVKLKIDGNITF